MHKLIVVVLLALALPALGGVRSVPVDTITVVVPMEVLGSRMPEALPGAIRPVSIQNRDEIASSPVRSVADALGHIPAVVSSQRQAFGVQSDLSVRGSSFDQVQLLLNGFDLSDPQTGHHLMNLPLALDDVQRIEVMPGHGSVLYGSGAFGGTVNVVPRRPWRGNGGSVGVRGGAFGTWAVRGEYNLSRSPGPDRARPEWAPLGDDGRGVRVSAERFRTDGHDVDGQWSGRDADHTVVTMRALDASDRSLTDLFLGLAHRSYGAQDFYGPTLAHEITSSMVATARHRRALGPAVVEARMAGRRHRDEFTLRRSDPQSYQNDHLTNRVLAGVRAAVPVRGAWAVAGDLEAAYEDIDSDGIRGGTETEALGEHVRRRVSASLELNRNLAPVRLQFGGRLDSRDGHEPRLGASAAAAIEAGSAVTLQASAGSVFRVPTFTDLYYADPYNRGNPDLDPESGWTWDIGSRYDSGSWHLAATYFERHEDDLIAWARADGDTVWNVMNVAEGSVRGLEVQAGYRHPGGHRLTVGWQNLNQERDFEPGTESKSGLVTPDQHVTGQALAVLPLDLEASLSGRYLHRNGGTDDFREVAVFSARLGWNRGPWTVNLDLHNLFDRRYEDIPGAVMPGRSVMVGASMMY